MVDFTEDGAQGAVNRGLQAPGVGVPIAAAVAAITVGLVVILHIPKLGILTRGILSFIVAVDNSLTEFIPGGIINLQGAGAAAPVQLKSLVDTTISAIIFLSLFSSCHASAGWHPALYPSALLIVLG